MGKYDKLKKDKAKADQIASISDDNLCIMADEHARVAEIYENADAISEDIDRAFCEYTKLDKVDVSFLMIATALQIARWVLLATINQNLDEKMKESRKKDDDPTIEKNKHEKQKKYKDKHKRDNKESEKYPTWAEIVKDGVPYDVTAGSKKKGINMGGGNHRVHTLGHDPALGWIFGTMNIITSSITTDATYNFRTFKVVKKPSPKHWDEETNIVVEFTSMIESLKEDDKRLPAAIFAQAVHLGSDYFTKKGLPIPFLEAFNSELASKLYKEGYDTLCLLKDVALVGVQAAIAVLINMLISLLHGLFYNQEKHENRDLYEVKTRKILSISNLIATSSNIIWVGGNMVAGNESAIKDLDVGGLCVTIHRLITDHKFIDKIKHEYIRNQWEDRILNNEFNFKEIT